MNQLFEVSGEFPIKMTQKSIKKTFRFKSTYHYDGAKTFNLTLIRTKNN